MLILIFTEYMPHATANGTWMTKVFLWFSQCPGDHHAQHWQLSSLQSCFTSLMISKNVSSMKGQDFYPLQELTHWGRVTHICVSKLSILGSDNGLSPGRRQAII